MRELTLADAIVADMSPVELRREWREQEDALMGMEAELAAIAAAVWPDSDDERPESVASGTVSAAELVAGIRSLHEYCARLLEENERLRGAKAARRAAEAAGAHAGRQRPAMPRALCRRLSASPPDARLFHTARDLEGSVNADADDNESTGEINRLSRENDELRLRLADAEGEGCTLHKHAPHGKEAEELRRGVEGMLRAHLDHVPSERLHGMLDSIDARDSLAHMRANELLRSRARQLDKLERELETVAGELYEAWNAYCLASEQPPLFMRRVMRAAGFKLSGLPKPLAAAGGKRGRQ